MEIAHVVSDDRHGPQYARAYLELIGHKLGREEQRALRQAFRDERVKVGPPVKRITSAIDS